MCPFALKIHLNTEYTETKRTRSGCQPDVLISSVPSVLKWIYTEFQSNNVE